MSEENYLTIRQIFNETLIRDVILFISLFIFCIAQNWNNILLFVFPLISFGFALFFRIIGTNKWRIFSKENLLLYNPIGSEKRHANRFRFISIFLLILIFWYGAESLYHPQLVDNYFPFFVLFFIFAYSFGFFWIFIDLWKFSGIKLIDEEKEIFEESSDIINKNGTLLSYLNLNAYKYISIINLFLFFLMNILNIIFNVFNLIHFVPEFYISLPGTGIEGSLPINVSFVLYVILIFPPISTIITLFYVYRSINYFSREDLNKSIEHLPIEIQKQVFENLQLLNKKLNKHKNL
ncbi:MAG: hypothetical protein EU550_00810 [Promethearchaeota archaeon]|nr:MAG: hypothetical protein EU550_00810 [Candidatus Lokiarchaeota archaeon]